MNCGDFQVGDVVVCEHLNPRGTRYDASLSALRLGGLYRVTVVLPRGSIGLAGVPSAHPDTTWWPGRFRKLPKADEQFTADLRARLNNRVPA